MRVVVFGTGTSQGIPVIGCECNVCKSNDPRDKRLRVSIWVECEGVKLLIDIGPDFRRQMLANDIKDVDALLLTHEHNDHTAGLDDIRPINFKYRKHIPVYGLPRVIKDVRQRFHYAFASNKYPGAPELKLHEIGLESIQIQGLEVQPISVEHGDLPILGFRIGDFAYLTDVKRIPELEMEKLQNLEMLIISSLRQQRPHHSHLLLDESLEWIRRIRPKQALLTHLSHKMGLHQEVEEILPSNVGIAYDGLELLLD